jgi:hypothetical protein
VSIELVNDAACIGRTRLLRQRNRRETDEHGN